MFYLLNEVLVNRLLQSGETISIAATLESDPAHRAGCAGLYPRVPTLPWKVERYAALRLYWRGNAPSLCWFHF